VVAAREGALLLVDVTASSKRLAVPAPAEAEIDGRVTLAFRPEAVTLSSSDDVSVNGTNTWEADVRAVAFLGDHYEYELNVGSQPLTVQSLEHVPGERIKVHIPPEACSFLSDPG
jgi:ABC-type sugar transport system ATPase subunit